MTQEAFIENFVLKYPRQYVRLISYNYPFDHQTLMEIGFMLAWDTKGLLGNSRINWTSELKNKFSNRLLNKVYGPSIQEYLKNHNYIEDNLEISLRKDKREIGRFKLDEITVDFIRKNKDEIYNWWVISGFYKCIDLDFALEFYQYLDSSHLFSNPYLQWADLELIKLYASEYRIVMCENCWNFFSRFINNETIRTHIFSMNKLDKVAKIHWKSRQRQADNTFKYLLGIYVVSEFGNQRISSCIYYDEKDIEKETIIKLNKTDEFPIREEYWYRKNVSA